MRVKIIIMHTPKPNPLSIPHSPLPLPASQRTKLLAEDILVCLLSTCASSLSLGGWGASYAAERMKKGPTFGDGVKRK
jgi:hypothetical protein